MIYPERNIKNEDFTGENADITGIFLNQLQGDSPQ
jgi:hypothetical protein